MRPASVTTRREHVGFLEQAELRRAAHRLLPARDAELAEHGGDVPFSGPR